MTKPSTFSLTSILAMTGMLTMSSIVMATPLNSEQHAAAVRHFALLEQAQNSAEQEYSDNLFNQFNEQLKHLEAAKVDQLCTELGRHYDSATSTCTG
ncbi:hypothetical protein [Shewanella sp.]|uniref:hypothetical protein n=1 Tax=Shewanella sp. TaxID=50422 RepID=UPI0035683249